MIGQLPSPHYTSSPVGHSSIITFGFVCWWVMTIQSQLCAHFTFYFLTFNHYVLGLNVGSVRTWSVQPLALRVSHKRISNSKTILVTWLKPSNESHGLTLTLSSMVVHHTDWTYCIFPLKSELECYSTYQK